MESLVQLFAPIAAAPSITCCQPRRPAMAVMAGGQSGDAEDRLRPVYFYADELEGPVAKRYRPG